MVVLLHVVSSYLIAVAVVSVEMAPPQTLRGGPDTDSSNLVTLIWN